MKIRAANITDKPAWLALRRRLRPALRDHEHERDWLQMMEQRGQRATLLCVDGHGASLGMIEVSRRAQMEEVGSGPVAYVDALHVEPGQEREATAQGLVDAAADWAGMRGCRVLAADTSLDNQWEQKLHLELGFEEVARKVIYRRALSVPATVYPVAPLTPAPVSLPLTDAQAANCARVRCTISGSPVSRTSLSFFCCSSHDRRRRGVRSAPERRAGSCRSELGRWRGRSPGRVRSRTGRLAWPVFRDGRRSGRSGRTAALRLVLVG